MNMKRFFSCLLMGILVGTVVGSPVGAAIRKESDRKIVGTDPAGDWGTNQLPDSFAPVGDLLGQDLVEAAIEMADPRTANFIITLNSLPAVGGTPEVSRYMWEFTVNSSPFMLDGRFTNYVRGICDPESGSCPPPRDPGLYPFSVRVGCGPGFYFSACPEIGLVRATFDPSAATISIPVPLALINAKPGSKIWPGADLFAPFFGGSVVAAPSAWYTTSGFPGDGLVVRRAFVVPRSPKT